MDSGTKAYDDLTAIKGIGSIRQQWLNETFRVYTFKALAALSVSEVEARLKAGGRVASRAEIRAWIEQAHELSASTKPQPFAGTTVEIARPESNSPTRASDWRPFASFVIEFQVRTDERRAKEYQTTIHHMEADTSAFWQDLKSEELCQWMRSRISETVEQEREEQISMPGPVNLPPVKVVITQVRAFQPLYATSHLRDESGKLFPSIIKGNEPFRLEVDFNVTGLTESGLLPKPLSYRGQLEARNLSNGKKIQLDMANSTERNAIQKLYTLRLFKASLQPGVYKMGVLIRLEGAALATGYLELPLVQAV